jgi:hypothetical protein
MARSSIVASKVLFYYFKTSTLCVDCGGTGCPNLSTYAFKVERASPQRPSKYRSKILAWCAYRIFLVALAFTWKVWASSREIGLPGMLLDSPSRNL